MRKTWLVVCRQGGEAKFGEIELLLGKENNTFPIEGDCVHRSKEFFDMRERAGAGGGAISGVPLAPFPKSPPKLGVFFPPFSNIRFTLVTGNAPRVPRPLFLPYFAS